MDQRPYPIPSRPWIMHQRWHDLLFAHWPVSPAVLKPLLPRFLELDSFAGECWLGVVPFWMSNVRPRGIPPFPGLSRFLELNVRTYVCHRGKPGVFFFSLDASNPVAVRIARTAFHLPYFDARMSMTGGEFRKEPGIGDRFIGYTSRRTHRGAPPASLQIRYRPVEPTGPTAPSEELTRWLTARYCLFTADTQGRLFCGEIHHVPWPLEPAEADILENTMAEAAGIPLPDTPPLLHFSRRIDVQIWPLAACTL